MVHFLRRKDSGGESSRSVSNSTITTNFSHGGASSVSGMGLLNSKKTTKPSKTSSFSFTREDQQLLLDYMVEKLQMKQLVPQMQTVASRMINPCTACTVPKDIMTYYDNFTLNDGLNNSTGAAADISMDITNFTAMSSTTTTSATLSDDDEENADDNPQSGSGLRFGHVHVREYNRTVGDHPEASDDGPPLSIDWDHGPLQSFPVGQYEAKKRKRRKRRLDRRIDRLRLEGREYLIKAVASMAESSVPRIKGAIRREVLHLDFDVPFVDLARAEAEAKRIQKQREESNQQTLISERTEELLQSAGRKLKRSFLFGRHGMQATSYYGGGRDDEAEYRAIVAENLRDSKLYGLTALQQSSPKVLDRRQPRRSKISPVEMNTNLNRTKQRYRPSSYKQASYRGGGSAGQLAT